MSIEEIQLLRLQPNQKIIHKIWSLYQKSFNLVLKRSNYCFRNLPIQAEDILNIFLAKTPALINSFYLNSKLKLKTFLCIKLKHIIFNQTRHYQIKKYKILNEASEYDEINSNMPKQFIDNYQNKAYDFDFSVLSANEYNVYQSHFGASHTISHIARENKVTRYKIEQILENIKLKMAKQI